MRAAVTGASGFIGSHLCSQLLSEGVDVQTVVRGEAGRLLSGLPVHVTVAPLSDTEALKQAFVGCDWVFHIAGQFSVSPRRRTDLMTANVDGTRNVLLAARSAGVRRLVFTSSTSTLGIPPAGAVGDELTQYNWQDYALPYTNSKFEAEQEVLRAAASGQDVVIVHPGTVIGPGDIHFNGGRWIREMARGRIPGVTDGGMNFVGVDDVVSGHFLAAQRGRPGQRYVLGGENLSYRQLFDMLADITGRPVPTKAVPAAAFKAFAAWHAAVYTLRGSEPNYTPQSVRLAYLHLYYSSAKAQAELGYSPTPVRKAFEDAYAWYKEHAML